MNEEESNKKIQLFIIIIGIILISIFIFIILYNPNILYTKKIKNLFLIIGALIFIGSAIFAIFVRKIDKNELLKNYRKILIEQYGENVNIKGVNSYEIVAGDKSKRGTLRKKIVVEMYVPQYNCTILNYKL